MYSADILQSNEVAFVQKAVELMGVQEVSYVYRAYVYMCIFST